MSVDMSDWSRGKKLKYSLLRRAFNQNRGGEVILLIQWRTAAERHKNAEGAAAARAFEEENAGQPRALRALNLIVKNMGMSTVYKDTVATPEQDNAPAANVYIKHGFLERILEGRDDSPKSMDVIEQAVSNVMPSERISTGYTRLNDLLRDFSKDNIILRKIAVRERIEDAIQMFKEMPVKSNDVAYRASFDEAAHIIKPKDYDDNEDAMDADEYTMRTTALYFDEDPDNDPIHDEVIALAAPKFGWN